MGSVRTGFRRAMAVGALGVIALAFGFPGVAAAQDLYPLTDPPTEVGVEDPGDPGTSETADSSAEVEGTPPADDSGSTLPFTGGDVLGLLALGAAVTAIGLGLTWARRRPIEV